MLEKINHYSLTSPATIYDEEALTALELAGRTAAKVNECVDQVNEVTTSLPGLIDKEVEVYLEKGAFDEQIDKHQQQIAMEVEESRLAMQNQLGNKLDKGSPGSVNMTMLSQDVKAAMTGGSVALVGDDAVGTANLKDGAVSPIKLTRNLEPIRWFAMSGDNRTPVIKLVSATHSAEFGRSDTIRFITERDSFDVNLATATLDVSQWNTQTVSIWFERETNTFHIRNALNFLQNYYKIGVIYTGYNNQCVMPIECDGALYSPHRRDERVLAQALWRPYNTDGTGITAYIDFAARELVIPQYIIVTAVSDNNYVNVADTTDGPIRIPFTDGAHQYLVANSASDIQFIGATAYNQHNSPNKYKFMLGYIEATLQTFTMAFPCVKGRTVSFLGDSITTYAGYIPDGNSASYTGTNWGVNHVYQTWWHRVMNRCGLALNTNNSWGGAKVSGTAASAGTIRATQLDNGSDPDIIIVYLGTNDFNGNVPLGEYNGRSVPVSTNTFREAYALMLKNILTRYHKAKVYVMTITACQRTTDEINAPEINGAGVGIWEYNRAIREIADMYHVEVIENASCQINNYNASENFGDLVSSTGAFLHPNKTGFKKIADKVIKTVLHSAE